MKRIIISTLIAFCSLCSWAITATEAFTSAPESVFPLLDKNTRLDMIDYFNSGMTTASQNKLSGKSRITDISDSQLQFVMTSSSSYQIAILESNNTQIIAVIETVATPTPDSNISFYTTDWKKYNENAFEPATIAQWLTNEGRDNIATVESIVPFMLSSMTYDSDSQILTLTNNVKHFLGQDMYSMIEAYLKATLTYKWNGKRFVQQK